MSAGFYFFPLYAPIFPVVIGLGFARCPVSLARSGDGRHRHAGALFDTPSCFIAPCLRSRTYHGGARGRSPLKIKLIKKHIPPPVPQGFRLDLSTHTGGGRGWAAPNYGGGPVRRRSGRLPTPRGRVRPSPLACFSRGCAASKVVEFRSTPRSPLKKAGENFSFPFS